MRKITCTGCGKAGGLPEGFRGTTVRCSNCKEVIEVSAESASLPPAILQPLPPPAPEPPPLKEYKVLTQKDKWFSGKFDPEKVEQAINSYAKQGWVLRGVATAMVPGFGGSRDEVMIFLERDRA